MNFLKKYRHIPILIKLLNFIRFLLEPKTYKVRRKQVLAFYKNADLQKMPEEIREGINFLKCHKYTTFPFNWAQKYDSLPVDVFHDEINNLFYVMFEGKKLYYPSKFTKNHCIWTTRSILKEQDPKSPHLYLTENFKIEPGCIVVDAGVAEGNFSLSIVEKAKKLYLIECDPDWINALKMTFQPWKDKVVFVDKFLSDCDTKDSVSLDSLIQIEDTEKCFIKMDIEGFEKKALAGMESMLKSSASLKMVICTYHFPDDLNAIESIISKYNIKWHVSEGYVLFYHAGEDPSFRKVLIRGEKY